MPEEESLQATSPQKTDIQVVGVTLWDRLFKVEQGRLESPTMDNHVVQCYF